MRHITISEAAYRACRELGDFYGSEVIMRLIQSAFDGNVEVGDVEKEERAVFIALRDGIDNSVYDDDEGFRSSKQKTGIAHVEMIPHMMDHDFFERFIRDLERALDDDEDDEGED